MQPVIDILKRSTRDDEQELRYLDSEINKKSEELAEITGQLESFILRRQKFIEHRRVISDFIALHENDNK